MTLNDLETEVSERFKTLRTELEHRVIIWVEKKLKDCKSQNKLKEVKIISGMGTWCFMTDGENTDAFKYKGLTEIDETLRLLAGDYELYLTKDIVV